MNLLKKMSKIAALLVGVVVAVALIGNAIWIHVTGSALEAKLAALRAEGQPLSIADLARKPIPADQNAATYLRRANDPATAIVKEMDDYYDHGDENGRLRDADVEKARAAFAAYPEVVSLLKRAADCPEYDSQLDTTIESQAFMAKLLPNDLSLRGFARALSVHWRLLLTDGKADDALEDVLTMLALNRHFEREPMLVSYMVTLAVGSVAIHDANLILQTSTISESDRQALEHELARQETADSLKHCLQTERAFGLTCYRDTIPWHQFWAMRGMANREEGYYLDFVAREITAADEPFWKYSPQPESKIHVLTNLLIPAMKAVQQSKANVQALSRSLRVINALQALPPEKQLLPPKLSGLGLPAEATVDPFNGKQLLVKKLPNGWLVYSVGPNGKDDDGDLIEGEKPPADIGLGPPTVTKGEADKSEEQQPDAKAE